MSLVAYFARMSREQIERCADNPDGLFEAGVEGVEVIDIDKAYEPLGWLLSPCKRAEQDYTALLHAELAVPTPQPSFLSKLLGRKAQFEPSQALTQKGAAADATPLDPLLIAIEGRSESRDDRFDPGTGPAAVFGPGEVARLAAALGTVSAEALRPAYDPELMDRMLVFPEHWREEGDELLSEYVAPSLARLQRFYRAATEEEQHVLVWYA